MGIRKIVEGETPLDSVDVIEPAEQEEIVAQAEETPDEEVVETEAETEVEAEVPPPVIEDPVTDPELEKKQKAIHALTLEEKRLRDKIVALHAEKRKASDPMFKVPEVIVDKKPDLADVADSDVELIEKVLRAKGYVKKDELQSMSHAEKLETYKDSWLKEHPEYLPVNDPDDVRWEALKQEIQYYREPNKPEDVIVLLNKAHSALNPHSLPVKNQAQLQAAKEKLNSSSKGAGGAASKSTPPTSTKVDPSFFKGFSNEELVELGIK